jgi:hypothetical protein
MGWFVAAGVMVVKRRRQGVAEIAHAFRKAVEQARYKTENDQDATTYQAGDDLGWSQHDQDHI